MTFERIVIHYLQCFTTGIDCPFGWSGYSEDNGLSQTYEGNNDFIMNNLRFAEIHFVGFAKEKSWLFGYGPVHVHDVLFNVFIL